MYANNAPKKMLATIENSVGASIIGPGGSRLIIAPNTFRSKTGGLISGEVNIEFIDYTNRADMIFSKVLPISNGEPLISGGEFEVRASVANQPVFIEPGKQIEVKLPQFGKSTAGMEAFVGTTIPEQNKNTVNWNKIDSTKGMQLVFNGDSISVFDDSCELANADRFISNPTYVDFEINIAGAPMSAENFVGYCFYKDFNGCWPMSVKNANTFSATHIPTFACHFVVFGFYNNEFYSGIINNFTPTDGTAQSLTLTKTDPLLIKATIKNL
jgi:hypothetical protein